MAKPRVECKVLKGIRGKIDALDARIVSLLQQRADLARRTALLKEAMGLPIKDCTREKEVLARLEKAPPGLFPPASLKRIYKVVIEETRKAEGRKK